MIVATAGHVDHGKTSLVRALTSVDTDRLPEERARGMTIDLGFAYLPVGEDARDPARTIGFIDVPGHERFIRNMLCGIGGIDFALLVVAADDGPMPQTREHLAILDLLGVREGAVALSKLDRVGGQRAAVARGEIEAMLAGTSLSGAPVFEVSTSTGAGVDALRRHLAQVAQERHARATHGHFRLAVDRCFSLPGTGLVVTGTVFSGSLAAGETARVLAANLASRVRSIHAQGRPSSVASAGQRCALNLAGAGLGTDAIARGEWIVAAEAPDPVGRLDVRLRLLPSGQRPLRHGTPVHVHLGAAHAVGRVAVLEASSIEPGAEALVQLVLDRPVGALRGDRFVVRDESAARTVGGGTVVDIFPPVRGRGRPGRLARLRAMDRDDHPEALAALLNVAVEGLDLRRFRENRNLTAAEASALFTGATMVCVETGSTSLGFSVPRWDQLAAKALANVAAWHERAPDRVGPPEDRILHGTDERLARETVLGIVRELARRGALVRSGAGVRLPSHRPRVNAANEALWRQIAPLIDDRALRPPSLHELADALGEGAQRVEASLAQAARLGRVVRVSPRRYYRAAALRTLAGLAVEIATDSPDGRLGAAVFRDRSGIGRNVSIEVLEFFDRVRFTRRMGDGRVILRPPGAGPIELRLPACDEHDEESVT